MQNEQLGCIVKPTASSRAPVKPKSTAKGDVLPLRSLETEPKIEPNIVFVCVCVCF